jgi:hypothetical protein
MKMRRFIAGVATAVMVPALGIAGATPALADSTWSGTITSSGMDLQSSYFVDACAFHTWHRPIYSESTAITPASDGTVALTVTSATIGGLTPPGAFAIGVFTPSYSSGNCVGSRVVTDSLPSLSFTASAGTTYIVVVWGADDDQATNTTGTFSVNIAVPGATAADLPPIPAWVQAYGRFGKDAPCLDGWSPSWQRWAEPVTGGWVCVRSIPSYGR